MHYSLQAKFILKFYRVYSQPKFFQTTQAKEIWLFANQRTSAPQLENGKSSTGADTTDWQHWLLSLKGNTHTCPQSEEKRMFPFRFLPLRIGYYWMSKQVEPFHLSDIKNPRTTTMTTNFKQSDTAKNEVEVFLPIYLAMAIITIDKSRMVWQERHRKWVFVPWLSWITCQGV